jgi:mRNA interferase RelE/StbE
MYSIRIKRSAAKQLEKLPPKAAERIVKAIDALAEDPRPDGVKKLQGTDDHYRIRIADYRVIYSIEDQHLIVEVVKVAHRKDVYK